MSKQRNNDSSLYDGTCQNIFVVKTQRGFVFKIQRGITLNFRNQFLSSRGKSIHWAQRGNKICTCPLKDIKHATHPLKTELMTLQLIIHSHGIELIIDISLSSDIQLLVCP